MLIQLVTVELKKKKKVLGILNNYLRLQRAVETYYIKYMTWLLNCFQNT